MKEDRGTGKTTRLMECAVALLAELPKGSHVFITGAHVRWLQQLGHEFKTAGLTDVVFLTPSQIINNGVLRGRRGVLLIDDVWDFPPEQRGRLYEEQIHLRRE